MDVFLDQIHMYASYLKLGKMLFFKVSKIKALLFDS